MIWIKKIIHPLLLVVLPVVVIACTVSYKVGVRIRSVGNEV